MSIFMNEKVKTHLAVINGKVDDGNLNDLESFSKGCLDFFSEVFKTNSPNHLSVYAGELTPKAYKIDEEITFEKVRDKVCADPAMAALMKKTEEKYSDNTVTVKMRNPLTETAEKLVEEKREIDKLVAELSPEVQTLMAEAFRTANKNRDRNRNRGRGHRE